MKFFRRILGNYIIFDLLIILCLSFVTFNWTKTNEIIDTNDTIYPLKPIPFFQQRLFQWNHSVGTGVDFSYGSAGLSWHGWQALIAKMGVSVFTNQKIFIFLLFNTVSFSIYFFLFCLLPSPAARLARITGVIFYSFNPYLFNLWGNLQSANLSAYVFIPLVSGLLIKSITDSKNLFFWFILIGVCSFFTAAFGMNPPVMIVVFIYFLFFFCYLFYEYVHKDRKISPVKFSKMIALFLLAISIFNIFWIVPELSTIFKGGLSLKIPSEGELRGWLDFVSQHTGFLNVIRMQGEWMWYENYRGEAYVPFARIFQLSFLLKALGLSAFVLSFLAIFKVKKRAIPFYSAILLLGLLFSMGVKPPLGYIYLFLSEKFKPFSFIRSPWYKFSLLTAIGYSVLVTYFVNWLVSKKNLFFSALIYLICLGQLVYSYPLITGDAFPTQFKILSPFRFSIPNYIWEADKWLSDDPEEFRVVVLPEQGERDFYRWGYSASAQILYLLGNSKAVLNGSNWAAVGGEANMIIDEFYKAAYRGELDEAVKMLANLNVKYLIQKNDYYSDFEKNIGSPEFIQERLSKQKYLNKVRTIGMWDFYEINREARNPLFYASSKIDLLDGGIEGIMSLNLLVNTTEKKENKNFPVIIQTSNLSENKFKDGIETDLYWSGHLIEKSNYLPSLPYIRVGPQNPFYFYIQRKEKQALSEATDKFQRIRLNLLYLGKRVSELEKNCYSNRSTKFCSDEILINLLNSYFSNLKEIDRDFSELFSDWNRGEYKLITELEKGLKFYYSKLVSITDSLSNQQASLAVDSINDMHLMLVSKIKILSDSIFSSEGVKKYLVEVPEEGEYRIYVENSGKFFNNGQPGQFKVNLNGRPVRNSNLTEVSNWVLLEDLALRKGKNLLELIIPEEKNPLAYAATPENLKLKDLDPGKEYSLNFEYNTPGVTEESKIVVSTCADQKNVDGKQIFSKIIEISPKDDFGRKEIILEASKCIGETKIFFQEPTVASNVINNFRLYQKFSPLVLVQKLTEQNELLSDIAPSLNFKQINPTEYLIEVNNEYDRSFFLVFSETFHPNWEVKIIKNNSEKQGYTLDARNHYKVNGYANAWKVDERGQFQVIVKYKTQKIYENLLKFSTIVLFFSFIYILRTLFWFLKRFLSKVIEES